MKIMVENYDRVVEISEMLEMGQTENFHETENSRNDRTWHNQTFIDISVLYVAINPEFIPDNCVLIFAC